MLVLVDGMIGVGHKGHTGLKATTPVSEACVQSGDII